MIITQDGSAIATGGTGRKSTIKDPQSTLDYSFYWKDWLAEIGCGIANASARVDDHGAITPLVIESVTWFDGIVTIFVSGGTLNSTHDLIAHIITDSSPPREDERTLSIKIRQR